MQPLPLDAAHRRSSRLFDEEDDELELPPLDGGAGDRQEPLLDDEDTFAEGDGGADDDAAGPVDLEPEPAIDVADERGGADTEPAQDAVDVGSMAEAVDLPDEDATASDEQGLTTEEDDGPSFDALLDGDASSGTSEDPSAFVDEGALPPLDGGDVGEDAPPASAEELTFLAIAPRQDRGRWRAAAGLGARVPCWLVAASAAHVVAAGPTVIVARGGGRASASAGLDIDAVAVAAGDDAVLAATRGGSLFVSLDGGGTWAAGSVPWPSARGPLAIAATPGRFWICEGGALWSVRWGADGRREAPASIRREGVRAMAAAGTSLVVLAERGEQLVIERTRGDDEAAVAEPLPAETAAALRGAPAILAAAAGGRALALLCGGVAHLSRDGGRSYRACAVGPSLDVAFAGQGEDAPAVVLLGPAVRGRESRLVLVECEPGGAPVHLAEIDASGGRAALAWDSARELLWVASGAGLLAFERAARH